jgi:hypothetical protein
MVYIGFWGIKLKINFRRWGVIDKQQTGRNQIFPDKSGLDAVESSVNTFIAFVNI